jgi:hypothetical protein
MKAMLRTALCPDICCSALPIYNQTIIGRIYVNHESRLQLFNMSTDREMTSLKASAEYWTKELRRKHLLLPASIIHAEI